MNDQKEKFQTQCAASVAKLNSNFKDILQNLKISQSYEEAKMSANDLTSSMILFNESAKKVLNLILEMKRYVILDGGNKGDIEEERQLVLKPSDEENHRKLRERILGIRDTLDSFLEGISKDEL